MTGVLGDLALALASGAVEVVDLTHALTPDFPVIVLPPEFGQCAPFRIEEVSRYDARGPAWYWNNISMSEHTGTHFDAPAHWVTGRNQPGGTVDAVAPDRLVAPVCVIDMSGPAAEDPDFIMTAAHVAAWEAEHGEIPAGAWVLMRTDWAKKAGTPAYVGLDATGAHSPGPDASAIEALLARDIIGFGTETVGTDAGQGAHLSPPYPAHSLLHGAGKLGLQCLAGLDRLPPVGAMLIAPPLKIAGGSGSPLRVLALIPGKTA
ncbi:cyclase family protein [Oceanicella sp. SM1341]|uniref:cyclase family protein n=1 Tax=Oceanicella sp. SM1341 TaxID=1548889 RepID=UPI000E505527|nr:cyclase family protein [Oceanicella sp. SM1341]